jgi:drug/metabolite transporter (DMT)-like permease
LNQSKSSSAGPLAALGRLPPNLQGALWVVGAAVVFSFNAGVVKQLGILGVDSLQTVFARSVVGFCVILPFVLRRGLSSTRTNHLPLHLFQGVAGTVALMAHFYAWTKLPLADVTALLFTQPLFALLLAVIILRSKVNWRRWLATAVGFLGVLAMVRPGAVNFEPATMIALFAGFSIALQLILVARLPAGEKELTMLFYLGLVSVLITVGPALAVWRTPNLEEGSLLLVNGLLGITHQAMIFRAFRIGDATYVAPFDYSKIVVAALIGFLYFSEIPDAWSIAGAAVIVASTYYISRREVGGR